jgi:hypothetical protein
MASYRAISAISKALVGLLKESASPVSDFSNSQFILYQASNFQTPITEGISVYLYRTCISTIRRNYPAKVAPDGRKKRPPLPVDLFYLVTPWAQTPDMEHLLLGWTMRTLEDHAVLPSTLLNQYTPETFGLDETVEIVGEQLSIQDHTNLWEVARHHVQVSVAYVARVVPIESTEYEDAAPMVQTRTTAASLIGGT